MIEKTVKGTLNSHRLIYNKPAKNWNEALPLGNGRIGAMLFGGASIEHIDLNEDTLWSGRPSVSKQNCVETYKTARELTLNGEPEKAEKLLEKEFGDYLVQMYLPLGSIDLKMRLNGEISDYSRELRLDKAVLKTSFVSKGIKYTRTAFISPVSQIMVIKTEADKPNSVSFDAELHGALKCRGFLKNKTAYIEGNAPVCEAPFGSTTCHEESKIYSNSDSEKGIPYLAAMTVIADGTEVTEKENLLSVENADSATVIFAVRTGFKDYKTDPVLSGKDYRAELYEDLKKAGTVTFEELLNACVTEHRRLYDRTELVLPESKNSSLPTDERLKLKAKGEEDQSLYALLFHFGRYLTVCASRKGTQPMNLQGIWNKELIPPWSSNYTLNINTEMNYWPTLNAGLEECYEPLIEMIKEMAVLGKKTAESYYNAKGWVSHHASDIWRVTHPTTNRINNCCQWGYWPMSSGWLTKMLFDYYVHTEDLEFLKEIYPVLKGSADFYKSMLTEINGNFVLCPSTSPENRYMTGSDESCSLDITTAMTTEIIRDVLNIADIASKKLEKSHTDYLEFAKKLPEFKIDSDGGLSEWYTEHEKWDIHHRHVSHLYALFPSNQITDETPKLEEACKRTLEQRGDGGTGWSLAWKINLWARLKDGEHALKLLDNQLTPIDSEINTPDCMGGSYPNLFCAHPPFQIDGNFGACNGIMMMLAQYNNGKLELLPALPKSWKDGALYGYHANGGKVIDIVWKDGKPV